MMQKFNHSLLLSFILALAACQSEPSGIQVLSTERHEALNLPFSEAVVAGGLIFLSGQIGA